MTARVSRLWLAAMATFVLAGCGSAGSGGSPEQLTIARALETTFPVAARLGVRVLTLDRTCWVAESLGGETRSVAPDGGACPRSADGIRDGSADAELHAGISAIIATPGVGSRLHEATFDFEFDHDWQLVGATFDLDSCLWYFYDPGYGELPEGDSYVVTRIDDDWYEIACPPTSPEPSSSAGPAVQGSASPAPMSVDGLLAPPPWFDPGTIPYLGSRGGVPGSLGDLWYGRLDGSDLRPVPVEGHGIGRIAGGGVVLVNAPGRAGSRGYRLVAVRPDGTTTEVLADATGSFAINASGDVVYAIRADARARRGVSGVWRVPLDGSRPRRVLPPAPGGDHVAVSPDERSFAMGWDGGDEALPITVRFDLGRPTRPVKGRAQGFDAAGRLIFDGGRYDPRSGRTEVFEDMGRRSDQLVTPDGRYLLEEDMDTLLALDLVTDARRAWSLEPGAWFVTELSTARYAVLARFVDDPEVERIDTFAIVDLYDGWLGYVPFRRP